MKLQTKLLFFGLLATLILYKIMQVLYQTPPVPAPTYQSNRLEMMPLR